MAIQRAKMLLAHKINILTAKVWSYNLVQKSFGFQKVEVGPLFPQYSIAT